MKMNLELDIKWLGEDETLDSAIFDRVVNQVSNHVTNKVSDEITKTIAARATALVNAKTELLIQTILEQPVTVSTGWSSSTTYDSLYDMIEQKMTDLYQGKYADTKSCGKDPLLVSVEKAVKAGFNVMVKDIEKKVTLAANDAVKREAKENQYLSVISKVLPIKENIK